ncbi:MAG: hypothetical protein COA46_00390 [Porticoccaceae bacterium]|nr:MAG: hypothetical protein COA46_00390 [Porticoccaceae bacterium]
MDFYQLLNRMVSAGASDLFLSVDAPAYIKVEGELTAISPDPLSSSQVHELVYAMLSDEQMRLFEETSELNIALRVQTVGRFRINVFRQMGSIALVARHIQSQIPSLESLGLPVILKELIMVPRGLVLLVGGTGTGKSTTLASMIDYRNSHKTGHILTIEDPVEFVHEHKKSLVNQREVGLDTDSYSIALKNAMREAPDVILIGEIRDQETMKSAMAYAETGHLCISTLHANNANQAIDRILNFFPDEAHKQLLQDLSLNLRAVVSQRLPIGVSGKRIAAVEVMLNTPYISDLIAKAKIDKIKEAMIQSTELGCQTFDGELFELVQQGKIDEDEALKNADSRNNLMLRFKLEGRHVESKLSITKDVAYAKFIQFDDYKSYRLKCVSASDDLQDRVSKLDESFRHAFFQKGLREDLENPDLEIQYVISSKTMESLSLKEIESPVSSEVDVEKNCQKQHGIIRLNMVDRAQKKTVWQVRASREIAMQPNSQSVMNRDAEFLFEEFPPPN